MEPGAIHPQVRAFLAEAEQARVLEPTELAALCVRRDQGDGAAADALFRAHFPMLGDLIQHLPRDFKTPELTERLLRCLRELTDSYDFQNAASGFGRTFSRTMRGQVGQWLEERQQNHGGNHGLYHI